MTIDEAIKYHLDIADGQDKCADISVSEHAKERISQCTADHRQLAEWLTELKELRCRVFADDPLIETTIEMLDTELREAKRLLKAAVEDMNSNNICFDINACNVCAEKNCISCDTFHWRYTDEALKLIGND